MPQNWTVYIDDSSDGKRSKYVVAGCLIGRKQDWSNFFKEWKRVLDSDPAIKYYHGKDLKGLKGPFGLFRNRNRWPNEKDAWNAAYQKRDQLRAVIDRSTLIGFGIGVHVPEYMRIRESHPRGHHFLSKDAFVFILQAAIYEIAKTVNEKVNERAQIAFISDDSQGADEYTRIYKDWKRWNPITAKSMQDIDHRDDRKYWGLQAADLAATTVKDVYEQHWETGDIGESFPLNSRFWRIAIIDERYMLQVLETQTIREPEKKGSWKIPNASDDKRKKPE